MNSKRYLTVNEAIERLQLLASDGCGEHILAVQDVQMPIIALRIPFDRKFRVTELLGGDSSGVNVVVLAGETQD